uniref:Uncharacterized protein n=1 Tax=Anopheles atroparvus TaxID=41427 RepID=A0A182IXW2_ANOAO
MYFLQGCTDRVLLLVMLLVLLPIKCAAGGDEADDKPSTNGNSTLLAHRSKRFLSYPVSGGISKVLFGFLAPVSFMHPLPRVMNCGVNLQANYVISPDIIFPRPESIFMNRALEGYTDRKSRAQVYGALEKLLRVVLGAGRRARECLLRTVCEVAETPLSHNGLVGELMDVILTIRQVMGFGWVSGSLSKKCDQFLSSRRSGHIGNMAAGRRFCSKPLLAGTFSVLLLVATFSVAECSSSESPGERALVQRAKRWILNYPVNGGVAKMVFGFLAPIRFHHPLTRLLNLSVNLQANYRILPTIIFPRPESIFKNRANSEYTDTSRKQLYALVEKLLNGWNRNGRSCLLRTICEVAETPLSHNGLVGELFELVFTPYETDQLDGEYTMARKYGANGVDCMRMYSACPLGHGLLDMISAIRY